MGWPISYFSNGYTLMGNGHTYERFCVDPNTLDCNKLPEHNHNKEIERSLFLHSFDNGRKWYRDHNHCTRERKQMLFLDIYVDFF